MIERVRRFGGALSHAMLDPSCGVFETAGIDGAVPYEVVGNCAVELGDPVCAGGEQDALQAAFEEHCRDHGWSTITVATTRSGDHDAAIAFADLLFADTRHDPESSHAGRHLRQNLNRVRREGVSAEEYAGPRDEGLESRAQSACERWRHQRGATMFVTEPRLFTERLGRRWFVARRGDDVVGLLSLLRAGAVAGNLVNLVFATPDAPAHTTDLLVSRAMASLREEGAKSICFGIGPRADIALRGFGRASTATAKSVYRIGDRLVHFRAKTAFWEKFGPLRREPIFIRFTTPRVGFRECRALFRVFHFSLV